MNLDGTINTLHFALLLGGVALLAGGFAADYGVAWQFSAKPARRLLSDTEQFEAISYKGLHNQQRRERREDSER